MITPEPKHRARLIDAGIKFNKEKLPIVETVEAYDKLVSVLFR